MITGADDGSGLLLWLVLTHAAATWFMVGLIWFVQVVHYPLFALVAPDRSVAYAQRHQRLTTWVVAIPMCLELITAAVLVGWRPETVTPALAWSGLVLVILIWLSTALYQVPQHRQLSVQWSASAHRLLVGTNWLRTVLWTVRGVLVLVMMAACG